MEEQIGDEDHLTRKQVQMILRPDDENMRYEVAILKDDEKHDAMGRSRRVTRIINYNEKRTYTTSCTDVEDIGYDRGQVQNTSQWGWRLYEVMKRW